MKDAGGAVLYVGKASCLPDRVSSYFVPSADLGARKQPMLDAVADFEVLECEAEWEALLLESRLVKDVQPRFNSDLKDDKTFPYLQITTHEDYPRVEFSRTPRMSGTASANYRAPLSERMGWFARGDYIFRGSTWATEANVAETGDSNRLNLRFGLETDEWTVEVYGTNVLDDDTFTGFQRFTDGAVSSTATMLTTGLPDKPAYGVRAAYRFGAGASR